jgi:peptide-methionine (S)-S-oxide reductase
MPTTDQQATIARTVIEQMQLNYNRPIVTTIEEATFFTLAEEYHYDYYARNPGQGYCMAVVGPKISKVRAKHAHLYTA